MTLIHACWAKSMHKCLQDQYQITTSLFKSSLYNLQEDSHQLYISWLIILIKLTGSTLVIQTENKIFRLYILLLHTPLKSLMYLMIYLSQPKSKNTLRVFKKIISFLQPITRNLPCTGRWWCCLMPILSVSQFQFIKPFCTCVHLPTPSLSSITIICYHDLPIGSFSYCSYCIVKVPWWFTSQRISSDIMIHFCSPTGSQAQLCLPIRGWVPYREQEQKSLRPVFRRATTSCWEWILPCFHTFENKERTWLSCVTLYE